MKRFFASAIAAAVLLGLASSAWGASGRVRVHGSLELRESYDNNVFATRGGGIGGFYTTISPSLTFAYRGPRILLDGESAATFFIYGSQQDLNAQFFHEKLRLEYKLTPRLSLEAEDTFTAISQVIGQPEDLASNLVQANTWRVGPIFRSELGSRSRMELRAGYAGTNYVKASFEDGETHDFGEASASLYLDREISERVTLFTRQEFVRRDYPSLETESFTGYLPLLGARIRLGRRVSADLSGGYQLLNFDRGRRDGAVINAAINYAPTLRTRITGAYNQQFTTDVAGKLYRQHRYTLGVERQVTPRTLLRLSAFYTQFTLAGFSTSDNNYFGGGLRIDHKLRRRLHLDLGWNYGRNAGGFDTDDFAQSVATIGVRYEF